MKSKQPKKWLIGLSFLLAFLAAWDVAGASPGLGEQFEKALGRGVVADIIEEYGGEYTVSIQKQMWVDEIFRRLASVAGRTELEYSLTVLNSREWNAFSVPGGYIFITQGLLKVIDEDETKLAAVLGHEIAHVELKHGLHAVLRQMGLTVLVEVGALWLDVLSADLLRMASATLLQLLQLGWGREAEFEADLEGQRLAVAAGFDGIGAVRLLEDMLVAEKEDLPMRLFRTHPETALRQERVAANLITFWSRPAKASLQERRETANLRRNSRVLGRIDPRNRYEIAISKEGLAVLDLQQNRQTIWLEGHSVQDFQWSPSGEFLAVIIKDSVNKVWLCDRLGHIVKQWEENLDLGSVQEISWSPQGRMIALAADQAVYVSYVVGDGLLPVSGAEGGSQPVWADERLFFSRDGVLYVTQGPQLDPLVILNPIPQVLRRKRILSPTIIRDGSTIRLTRPALTLP